MTREIKFKVEIDGQWIALTFDKMLEYAEQGNDIIKDCRKRQYTGLKDKNGVEIYEGDIVKAYDVDYCSEIAFIYGEWHAKQYGDSLFGCSNEFEVIGNIYENTELLEQTK